MNESSITELVGKTLKSVTNTNNNMLTFTTVDDVVYTMYHYQECCEDVEIEDINGDLHDLIGTPILVAQERTSQNEDIGDRYCDDEYLWTFYTIRTIKGSVDIRWFGTSNGYYSVNVSFHEGGCE